MSIVFKKVKSNLFLSLIILAYLILMVFMPEKGMMALKSSLYYVKEMLIIMPVILLLTALIEAWVPKKTIENALGEGSGLKGYLFSFLFGSFSAGPIYAAFPVCKMLLKKGASITNIIIILSAWAVIKIPMLANEAKFLSPKFMIIRWALTTISILIMAIIASKVVKKEDMPIDNISENKESILTVNESFCLGCKLCTKISPDNFVMSNKKAKITKRILRSEENEGIRQAIDKCPAKAINYK